MRPFDLEPQFEKIMHRYHFLLDDFLLMAASRGCKFAFEWHDGKTVHLSTIRPSDTACTRYELRGAETKVRLSAQFELFTVAGI